MLFAVTAEMNSQSQPSLRDQLFESTALALEIIRKVEPSGLVDLSSLKDGLRSLQDTLLGSMWFPGRQLDPFYLLCLQICDAMTKQASPDRDASQIIEITVTGYNLYKVQEVLLALFHALSTYLNIIRWYVKIMGYKSNILKCQAVLQDGSTTTLGAGVWPA